MDKILEILAQHGPFALLSGGLLYLFVILWKRFQEMYLEQHRVLLENTTAISQLTRALEDVVASVEAQGEYYDKRFEGCTSVNNKLLDKVEEHIANSRIERAREEGRRSATNPFGVPIHIGEDNG